MRALGAQSRYAAPRFAPDARRHFRSIGLYRPIDDIYNSIKLVPRVVWPQILLLAESVCAFPCAAMSAATTITCRSVQI